MQVLSIEAHVIGRPEVASLPAELATLPGRLLRDLVERSSGRYVVDVPAAVEVLPGRGDSWIGPMRLSLDLDDADVDHLVNALKAAGWRLER